MSFLECIGATILLIVAVLGILFIVLIALIFIWDLIKGIFT